MAFLDRFLDSMRFDDDFEDEYMDVEEEEVQPRRRYRDTSEDEEDEIRPRRSKIMAMPKKSNKGGAFQAGMGVCVVKPTAVEDAQVIIDTLLDNRTVVVNLEGITTDTAQRIMDITFGANVALDGHLQQVSRNIFIVTPKSVALSGDITDSVGNSQVDMFGIAK